MSAGLDRKDQAIWDALEANKTKQALQLCAKRLKKGEKGDYLYVCLDCHYWPGTLLEKVLELM